MAEAVPRVDPLADRAPAVGVPRPADSPALRPTAPIPPADWPTAWTRLAHPGRMLNIIAVYPEEAYREPIVERHFRGRRHLLVNDPDGIGHVLQHNAASYVKSHKMKRMLTPIMGESVITTEGADWQRQRRIIAPAFRHASVMTFVPQFVAKATVWQAAWERRAGHGPVDMVQEMQRLALAVFGAAMFGADIARLEEIPATARRYLRHAQAIEALVALGLPERVGLAVNHWRARAVAQPLHAVAEALRQAPADAAGSTPSLLAILQDVQREEAGRQMSAQEVEDQIATLLLAGHSTSAGTLCWLWYLLDLCPSVRQRLDAELAAVLGGRPPTAEDLPRLGYTRMVIDERPCGSIPSSRPLASRR